MYEVPIILFIMLLMGLENTNNMISKTLSHHLKRGKLRIAGKPLYQTLIGLELKYIRFLDRKITFKNIPLVDSELTAVIKTFERPEILKRLIESIKRIYPNMKIIVVDDSLNPLSLKGVETIVMPYNSGISAGRNRALETVKTKYVLFLDDDFIFYHKTEFEPALRLMEEFPQIDIMGGEVVNLPSFKSSDYRKANLHPTQSVPVLPPGSKIGGLPVYDKVPNFFIARPEKLKLVGWDEQLKKIEHADFFTRAKGVLVTVYNKHFKVLHAQTPFDDAYLKIRHDVSQEKKILYSKYYEKQDL